MIPFSDPSEPNRIFPWVNIGLILVNFAVFFYELSLSSTGSLNSFFLQYGVVPCEYSSHCLAPSGAPNPYYISLLSSMFMHAGWLHLLGNMLYLWVFGDNIENSMGHIRYLVFYLLCGAGANALQIATAVDSQSPGLGASGAIAGVLGAYLMLYPSSRIRTLIPITFIFIPVRLPAWVLIGFWFILQLFNGLIGLNAASSNTSGIAYFAHVGGFLTGAILIWFFRHRDKVGRMRSYHYGRFGP